MLFAALLTATFGFQTYSAQYCSSETTPRVHSQCGTCPMIRMPCDFASLKEVPHIVFVGETHTAWTTTAVRDNLLIRSIKGQFPVASETKSYGPFFPWHKNEGSGDLLLHGIESHQPYAVVLSYLVQNEYVLSDRPRHPEKLLRKLKEYIATIPLFRDAFTQVKGLPSLKGKHGNEIETKVTENVDQDQVYSFAQNLHLALIGLANDPQNPVRCMLGNKDLRPLLKPEDRSVVGLLKPDTLDNENNFGEILVDTPFTSYDVYRVFYSVRNREFARATAEMVCRYAGKYPKVFINLGEKHVNIETGAWLHDLTDGRIKSVEFLDTRKPEDAETLRRYLKELGTNL